MQTLKFLPTSRTTSLDLYCINQANYIPNYGSFKLFYHERLHAKFDSVSACQLDMAQAFLNHSVS